MEDIETNFIVPHSKEKAQISHIIKIVNDNDLSLHVDSMYYKMYLDNEFYGEGKTTEDFTIKANDTSDVKFAYPFELDKFIQKYEKTGKDSAAHRIEFDFYVDLWRFNSIHVPYTFTKNSPVFKMPTAKMKDVKLTKLGLKESRLQAEVLLHNPGDIMYDAYSMRYSLNIEGVEVAKGDIEKDKILRRESSLFLNLPIQVSVDDLVKRAGLLKKGFKDQQYKLSIHIELKPPPEKNVPTSDFDIVNVGKVEDLIQDYKKAVEEKKAAEKAEKGKNN